MPPGRQLNIRLSPRERDQLEALAFLRRLPASVLARDVLFEYLQQHREDPGLQSVLKGLAEHDCDTVSAKVTKITPRPAG